MQKYFSYPNWEVVFGSAFSMSDNDREKLRRCDGTEASPLGKVGILKEETYMVVTPWGINMYPAIVVKEKDEPDISALDVARNPQLQREITFQNRKETSFEDNSFKTIAYIDKDSSCGFAMVSVGIEPGTFKLRSFLYEIPSQLKDKIDYEIRPRFWQYWHNGILEGDDTAKVYRMNIERVEHYIEALFPERFNPCIIDKENAYNYLTVVGSNEYESDAAYNKMLKMRRIYEKQCSLLMESLNLRVIGPKTISCATFLETQKTPIDRTDKTNTDHSNSTSKAQPKGKKYEKIQALKSQGLSIGQVAQKLGMSYSAVSKLW